MALNDKKLNRFFLTKHYVGSYHKSIISMYLSMEKIHETIKMRLILECLTIFLTHHVGCIGLLWL